ncbi:MAG: LLM class flavin-dependent oxidoreductase [Candidatus Binataceae bacterium]
MREIKFNLTLPMTDLRKLREYAELAETLGYYSVSFGDHLYVRVPHLSWGPQVPHLECFMTLSSIAASTRRVRLAPLVAVIPFRNPALLAKMTSTIDQISGGRLIAGLGSGWFREELEAYGFGAPTDRERIDRMDEAIRVLKAMWTQDEPSYRGRYYAIDKAYNFPKPLQKPHPPIMIGGAGTRVLEIAAREADIVNVVSAAITTNPGESAPKFDKPQLRRRLEILHDFARAAGREPESIEISSFPFAFISRDKTEADAMGARIAQRNGYAGVDEARQAPGLLLGTPQEIRRELRSRIEEFNMTYHMVSLPNPESVKLFAAEVMPEFIH